ncbi:hypothetical protein BDB01DRAFT_812547 [Pilobolus umbonatus]|nr:hypothetical protein BDB01DRAFT_812547 [Pilobolus umbonatus]
MSDIKESKGLSALFGVSVPLKVNNEKKEQPAAVDEGVWKTASGSGSRRLALKARGRNITVAKNRKIIPDEEDGDVTMGGTGNKKKKKKRFSPYMARPSAPTKPAPIDPVRVVVSGYEPGTEPGVVPFLVQKSKKKWEPVSVELMGGFMVIALAERVIAHILVRLDGYMFGTQQLRISFVDPLTTPINTEEKKKSSTVDILRDFLRSRYRSDQKFLNLDDMAADPMLKQHAIRPPGASNSTAIIGSAMLKLASEMFEDVVTISLAGNHLKNLQQFATLPQYLPNVQNISLLNNLIKEYEGLDVLSGTGKLTKLRELMLIGNPLSESELKQRGNNRAYVRNIVKRFPTLGMLDGEPIQLSASEADIVYKTTSILPLDNKPSFFDNEVSQAAAMDFLEKYFTLFDADRSSIGSMYDDNAIFSITTHLKLRSHNKLRRKDKKNMMEDEDRLNWTQLSRNQMGKPKKQEGKGLIVGPEAIQSTLNRLPTTKHELHQKEQYIVDAHQSPVGLVICFHGEFKEDDGSPPYSLDRTFLLRPATPDSSAMKAGWPYIIMSDMLCVRDYIGCNGFKPLTVFPISQFHQYL